MSKTTYFYPNKTLKLGGMVMDLSTPKVMGILNITPDSFFDGGRFISIEDALKQADRMITEGADMLDIGGMSSKPGSEMISVEDELNRVMPVLIAMRKQFPQVPLSIDTIHGKVAEEAIQNGAVIVNDISAGRFDPSIIEVTAKYKVPYILMHMQGTPKDMQGSPQYENVTSEVFNFLVEHTANCFNKGIHEIIIDPGFGFGKSLEHNYQLIHEFEVFQQLGLPLLAGISRKSMICKLLKLNPDKALNGTTALHAILLLNGASILRVHDVKEAVEVVKIARALGNRN